MSAGRSERNVPRHHATRPHLLRQVDNPVTNIGVDEDKRVPVEAATQVCDSWAEKE
jgi:hypothetical protein